MCADKVRGVCDGECAAECSVWVHVACECKAFMSPLLVTGRARGVIGCVFVCVRSGVSRRDDDPARGR